MWNTFGSLRERVREHAKSAAQVAQGVLQAAAAEDEAPESNQPDTRDENFGAWDGWRNQDQDAGNSVFDKSNQQSQLQSQPPPSDNSVPPPSSDDPVLPPLSDDATPPLSPPPEDSFISAKPPVLNSAPRSRASRYVVTGVATAHTQSVPLAPVVPKPSSFAPKPANIPSQSVNDPIEEETKDVDTISAPPVDVTDHTATEEVSGGNSEIDLHVESLDVSTAVPEESSISRSAPVLADSSIPANVSEPAKRELDLWSEQNTIANPTDDTFTGWGVATEQQNGQSTAKPPDDDSFAGWSVEQASTEPQRTQNMAPPPTDDSAVAWNVPETETGQLAEVPPVEDRFAGWSVPETSEEQQTDTNAPETGADDTFTDWSIRETSTELQQDQPKGASPDENNSASWNVPDPSVEQQNGQDTEKPVEDTFAGWDVPELISEHQQDHNGVEPSAENRLASWDIHEASEEQRKDQNTFETAADDTLAGRSALDRSTEQQVNEANGWDMPKSAANPSSTGQSDEPPKDDAFVAWGSGDGLWNLGNADTTIQDGAEDVNWFSSEAANIQDAIGDCAEQGTAVVEESHREKAKVPASEPERAHGILESPEISLCAIPEERSSGKLAQEQVEAQSSPKSQSVVGNVLDHESNARPDDHKNAIEISPRIPGEALPQDTYQWSSDANARSTQNGIESTSTSAEQGQWNMHIPSSEVNAQETVPRNPIISSDPMIAAESWFSDYVTQETKINSSREGGFKAGGKNDSSLYETASTRRTEQQSFPVEQPEISSQISKLEEQLGSIMMERDAALAAKETSERDNDDLKGSIALAESNLTQSREEAGYLATQRDALLQEKDDILAQKLEAEKERDEAIHRGGEGLREARNIIEVMRSNQDTTDKREAAITEQIEALRSDLGRISEERNSLVGEAEDLRIALRDMESRSRQTEDDLRQRLQIAEHESEIARLEREKAIETNKLHMEENRRLSEAEKVRVAALTAHESKVLELENYIASMQTDREDENLRIDLFSKQIEEMKDRTQGVINERNELYDQNRALDKQIEDYRQREEKFSRELQDAKRETAATASERDEAKQRFVSIKEQQKDLTKRMEALAGERDQLVQARTAAAASSSVSDKEKALAKECEQKTRAVAVLQKKLSTVVAKTEKVAAQRAIFQRQRDEAGARLRAAGVEFAAMNSKLEEVSLAKDAVQNQLVQIRNERDSALSRTEEMAAFESQLKIARENLDSKSTEVEELQSKLKQSIQEVAKMQESNSSVQQKVGALATELKELQGRLEVVSREKGLLEKQKGVLEEERNSLQETITERESSESRLSKQMKSMEADYATLKETFTIDLGIAKAELESERKLRQDLEERFSNAQNEISQYSSSVNQVHSTIGSCVALIRSNIGEVPDGVKPVEWRGIEDLLKSEDGRQCVSVTNLISRYGEITTMLIKDIWNVIQDYDSLRTKCDDSAEMLAALEQEKTAFEQDKAELLVSASEAADSLRSEVEAAKRELESSHVEKLRFEKEFQNLQEQLASAVAQRSELEARLGVVTDEMQEELQRRIQVSIEERDRLLQETEKVTTNLNSIWTMLQKVLGHEQLEVLTDETGDYVESDDNVAILALRATASVVAEVSRSRSHVEDMETKLVTAEAEAARLIDRAEIAEQERDTAKGTNERLERKLNLAHAEGKEEAKVHYEGIVGQLEDEIDDAKQEFSRMSDRASRFEKEAGDLRALCSKLTSQFNGRTNELDEAEEKVVYLQDQVTTLEEDLEEAHSRLKKLEEESAEARQSDVNRMTNKLEEMTTQLEEIENECTRLREAHDEAEKVAKESQLLAETHKKAEENLQIAIEQLGAAQESVVEQRTIELQKKLEDAEQKCKQATEREAAAAVTQKQLNIRDEEIKELRGAIGRLADERVELKLELEKSLSRLNHPDAGVQLVDRRVVRQLLVSYFRVGSVRRRDVLELMSRMLAFSDADNVAVGLKRRALMDRLGSLVQAPELDDASLPPLGTVSDKWIEFLMKETEEGEEQAKGW